MPLSVVIPTFNEQHFIENCLKSVKFADEIVIIDSGSTDRTLIIAQKYGAKIIHQPWQGYLHFHNTAPQKTTHQWLFYLDADERVSATLRRQIQETLENPQAPAYQMPRKNFFFGQPMRHGGWYPDLVTRLINKRHLQKWVGDLHEYPLIDGSVQTLNGHIYHLTHRGIEWSLHKSLIYTRTFAQILYQAHHPPVKVKNFFGSMAREFYYRAIKKSGWKDGFVGWLEIIYQTFNAFLIQVWLWEMQQPHPQSRLYRKLDKKLSSDWR